eukprot:6213401-Prymnesium_polylepis.2
MRPALTRIAPPVWALESAIEELTIFTSPPSTNIAPPLPAAVDRRMELSLTLRLPLRISIAPPSPLLPRLAMESSMELLFLITTMPERI